MKRGQVVDGHEQISDLLAEIFTGVDIPLEIPPPIAEEQGCQFVSYTVGQSLQATFVPPRKFTNPAGILQGGALCAYFDSVMGPLSYLVAKKPTTTVDLITHFLRPIKVGSKVMITSKVVSLGRNMMHLEASAQNEKGKQLASAQSNLFILPVRKS